MNMSRSELADMIESFPDNPVLFIETYLKRELTPKQKLFINSTKTKNHIVARWSRQTGKSTVIASYIVWRLLFGKGVVVNGEHMPENIVVVAPIKDQVTNLYDKIRTLIDRTPFILPWLSKVNSERIIAKSGNKITFISASPGSHIRGATATCIVIDETQDVIDEKYYSDVLPFGSTTNALIIEAGTPKTKNHFYETIMNKDVTVISQMYWECPFLSEEYIEQQKSNMPEALFRQEYMCEFMEEGVLCFPSKYFKEPWTLRDYEYMSDVNQLTTDYRVKIAESRLDGATYYMGNDLGRAKDHTVVTVWRTDVRPIMLEFYMQFPLNLKYTEIIPQVARIYDIYRPVEYNLDYTNEKSFADHLIEAGVPISLPDRRKHKTSNVLQTGAIAFTQKNKTEMINNCQLLLENRQICFPKKAELLLAQFMNQQFEYNEETKNYKYYHPTNEHDDGLWAALLALKNVKLQVVDTKMDFANPWSTYDEQIHPEKKTGYDARSTVSNLNRHRLKNANTNTLRGSYSEVSVLKNRYG